MRNIIGLKVLNFFLENPYEEVYLRELAKMLNLSPSAVKKYVDLLVKENLAIDGKRANLRLLKANHDDLFYKHLKIAFNVKSLSTSGLIEFIEKEVTNISSIVLFGSMARGENDDKSDIDILVVGKHKLLKLNNFEKNLNRNISVHIFSWSEWKKKSNTDQGFYYDIIVHGIPLYGELPLTR
jgi:uncharacterized protein